jgi:hypothetical protein
MHQAHGCCRQCYKQCSPLQKHRLAAAAAAAEKADVQPDCQQQPHAAAAAAATASVQPKLRLTKPKRKLQWKKWEKKLFEQLLKVEQEEVSHMLRGPCSGVCACAT